MWARTGGTEEVYFKGDGRREGTGREGKGILFRSQGE